MKFTEMDIPGKGRGLVAVKDIKKGELMLKEKRIIRGLGRGMAISSMLRAFILREIANPSDRAAFLSLYDPDPSGPVDMKEVRIYQSNAFADGVFLTCSKMNHSCKPAKQMSSDDEIETEVRALRDIKVGEEITVSYLRSSALRTKEERMEELKQWGFVCSCSVCSLEGENLQLNDKQRKKVRESMDQVSRFFDGLAEDPSKPPQIVKRLITKYFKDCNENLGLLEGDLEGQAVPAIVTVLLDLSELAELARTGQFRTKLAQSCSPKDYFARAMEKAQEVGAMFVSNCRNREMEMMGIRMAFL